MPLNFIVMTDPPTVAMFDDRSQRAFGPVVTGDDAMERLAAFLTALDDDPRTLLPHELDYAWAAWQSQTEIPNPDQLSIDTADDMAPARTADSPAHSEAVPGEPSGNLSPTAETAGLPSIPAVPLMAVTPAGADLVTLAQSQADNAPADVEVTPPGMPVGSRVCWLCKGHRVEPDKPSEPCGICVGKGWLPS